MIALKPVKILHFEDNEIQRTLITRKLEKEFDASVRPESTLDNLKWYTDNDFVIGRYAAVICDIMFPKVDIYKFLKDLAECGKQVIFYSCVDEENWFHRVKRTLKEMPKNFHFIQKGSNDNLPRLCHIIEGCI